MERQTYHVRGMTCASCEIVIERELLKVEGITDVQVSLKDRTLIVEADGPVPTPEELTALLGTHGYSVGRKEKFVKGEAAKMPWHRLGGVAVIVMATYILFGRLGILTYTPSGTSSAGLFGIFVIGLIASVSSCTAVLGGLVTAVSGGIARATEGMGFTARFAPHLLFNLGRVGGFALLGAAVGMLGSTLQLTPALNGLFTLLVAILMVAIGLNLLEVAPPFARMPKRLAHAVHDLAESRNPAAPLVLGASTFFLPCGFTQSMQLYALSLQDPLRSGLVMAVFALGTAPVLLGLGGAVAAASGAMLKRITAVAGVLVLVLGISNAGNGLALLGIDPAVVFARRAAARAAAVDPDAQWQRIDMRVAEYGAYEPDVLAVWEGIPVEWHIQGAAFMGCADSLVLPAFGVAERLRTGENIVRFTPTKAGTYVFSCSMGMIRGTMQVIPQANPAQ